MNATTQSHHYNIPAGARDFPLPGTRGRLAMAFATQDTTITTDSGSIWLPANVAYNPPQGSAPVSVLSAINHNAAAISNLTITMER
jgi:hypothetical protein